MTGELFTPAPTRVMGILNVTPDSFSDGGDFFDHRRAIDHGLALAAEGAQLIDVGGESTRPGVRRTEPAEELRRVLPVVEALAASGVPVSVDTMRAEVARETVRLGAAMINDVSGGLADEAMLPTVADLGVPYVAMHWRAHSAEMANAAHYTDVVAEVRGELTARARAALAAGIAAEHLVLDPGIGFAKTGEHNWQLLRRIDGLAELGHPLLVGVSRKRFLGQLLADEDGPRPPKGRDDASVAISTLLATHGIWAVRTHSVRAHRDAILVADRFR